VPDGVDQIAGRGKIPNGFGNERLAQRQPIAGRAAVAAPLVTGHMILRVTQLADRHKLPVLIVRWFGSEELYFTKPLAVPGFKRAQRGVLQEPL